MRLVKGMILDCCVRKSFNARTPPVGAVNRKKDELPGLLN